MPVAQTNRDDDPDIYTGNRHANHRERAGAGTRKLLPFDPENFPPEGTEGGSLRQSRMHASRRRRGEVRARYVRKVDLTGDGRNDYIVD